MGEEKNKSNKKNIAIVSVAVALVIIGAVVAGILITNAMSNSNKPIKGLDSLKDDWNVVSIDNVMTDPFVDELDMSRGAIKDALISNKQYFKAFKKGDKSYTLQDMPTKNNVQISNLSEYNSDELKDFCNAFHDGLVSGLSTSTKKDNNGSPAYIGESIYCNSSVYSYEAESYLDVYATLFNGYTISFIFQSSNDFSYDDYKLNRNTMEKISVNFEEYNNKLLK